MKNTKLSLAIAYATAALLVTACGGGGSSSGGSSNPSSNNADWAQSTGEIDFAHVYVDVAPEATCIAQSGDVLVKGAPYDEVAIYTFGKAELGNWPGVQAEKLDGCSEPVFRLTPDKDIVGSSIIANNNGNGLQTPDLANFTIEEPCISFTGTKDGDKDVASLTSARACGITIEGETLSDNAYIFNGDTKLVSGDKIEINALAGNAESETKTITLAMSGEGVNADSTGYYWVTDDDGSIASNADDAADADAAATEEDTKHANHTKFKNGEKITIGAKIRLKDGETQTKILHVSYKDAESTFLIKKTYSVKNREARLAQKEASNTLGANYSKDQTVFRIWSPDSSDVKVEVAGKSYDMKPATLNGYTNVYEATVAGDLAGEEYSFYVGGTRVRDPYAKMAKSGNDGIVGIVMDMSQTEPEGGWADVPALNQRVDSIVYEVHVRDFTIDESSGVDSDKKGRYLGMVQTGTTAVVDGKSTAVKTGIDHLKELGVTHVQIQPFYDYGTCSDVDSQNGTCYNWGYDPINYNVPEERYSSAFKASTLADYNTRVKEVKTMINEFHKNGIRVIMDVVYNHTWNSSVFDKITSKYYFKNNDLSGCGNAIDADQNMVWMMIRDSLDYWVSEYHIDGFRFDLVGVFNSADYSDWGEYLNTNYSDHKLVIYGEPWTGGGDSSVLVNPVRTGNMKYISQDAHVGAFNNRIRNCLKGASDSSNKAKMLGFIFGYKNTDWDGNGTDANDVDLPDNKSCVLVGLQGGVRPSDAKGKDIWTAQGFMNPEQSVSYVTAHDNLALRDKIERAKTVITDMTADSVKKIQAYANGIILVSQGVKFIHGGEEFGRTKVLADNASNCGKDGSAHNSYNCFKGNDFDWTLKAGEWGQVNDYYKAMIALSKAHPAFHMTDNETILKAVTLDEANSTEKVVIVNIDGSTVGDSWTSIKLVMNSDTTDFDASKLGVEGMTKVAGGFNVDQAGVDNADKAEAQSLSIWVK